MAVPYTVHLVFGTVTNSKGIVIDNARLQVISSVATRIYNTNSDGIYMFDLADQGYEFGETVEMNVTEPFNNELATDTFVVTGSFTADENITLASRTAVENISNLNQQNVLHNVGKKPITKDNPLAVETSEERVYTRALAKKSGSQQPEYLGWASPGIGKGEAKWRIQKLLYDGTFVTDMIWAEGNTKFNNIWDKRVSLEYS